MKKLMFSAALMAASVLSLSAQEKGDFTVGGMIGVSGGSYSNSYTSQGITDKYNYPSPTSFSLSPQFSYFVIDNLELSAGLEYNMEKSYSEDYKTDKTSYTTHIAMFTIGANYYVPIIKDKLFYTPGVQFGFGGGSNVYSADGRSVSTKRPFDFGFSADLGKFEFKPLDFLGISLNILNFTVLYSSVETNSNDSKESTTSFTAGFNYGMSVGVKYYF